MSPHRKNPYVECSLVMSRGGGRFDFRFDLRVEFSRGPAGAAGGRGDGITDERVFALRDGVRSALMGGGWLNDVVNELERGGTPGDGLMVDENGTYVAEGGMPVGVDVRSERDEPDPE